ncbi:hypothetical protein FAGKG844_80083 [Frankia sp. AgKG'84/4]
MRDAGRPACVAFGRGLPGWSVCGGWWEARRMIGGGGSTAGAGVDGGWDFFVSYTAVDQGWAQWIAWALEEAKYQVLLQAWDFVPGSNWVGGMHDGVQRAARTIAVLSDDYARSVYGAAEWQAAWGADPTGAEHRLLVVRIADCDRPGLLASVVSTDLFGLPADQARAELLRAAALAVPPGGVLALRPHRQLPRPARPTRHRSPLPSPRLHHRRSGPRTRPPQHPGQPQQPRRCLPVGGTPRPGHHPVRTNPHRPPAHPRTRPPHDGDHPGQRRSGARRP